MSDRGISFTGDGAQDVGGMPAGLPTGSLSEGGPIKGGPESNMGMTSSSESVSNTIGGTMTGGGIKFAGDRDSD